MSKRQQQKLSNIQEFCYERNMVCTNCLYSKYNEGVCHVKDSIKEMILVGLKPYKMIEKGIDMNDHGYERAAQEYESRLFDGPPKTEEELEEEYEDELDYRMAEAEYQMDELWMERNQ